MKFDINQYNEEYAMHCKTEDEANFFLKYLDSLGMKWCSGQRYIENTNYKDYRNKTCYCFKDGSYSNYDYFRDEGYVILEFEDFEWDGYTDELEIASEEALLLSDFISGFCVC